MNHVNNFRHLLVNRRLIVVGALTGIVLLAMNLEKTIVKVRSELSVLEEILVYIKFFVKDATVLEQVVLLLACVNDCLKLSGVLSVEHLLAKL